MLKTMALSLALLAALATVKPAAATGAYDFTFTMIDGKPLRLADFRGKAIMVVNTASFCGFTPQYRQLQTLWETYRERGLVLIGAPSNDFGRQEPGSSEEIKEFCEVNYRVDFPLTEKVSVTGDSAHPFYRWAADELGAVAQPRWNFHKYLINANGQLVDWFSSITEPSAARVIRAVEAALPPR